MVARAPVVRVHPARLFVQGNRVVLVPDLDNDQDQFQVDDHFLPAMVEALGAPALTLARLGEVALVDLLEPPAEDPRGQPVQVHHRVVAQVDLVGQDKLAVHLAAAVKAAKPIANKNLVRPAAKR